MTDEDDPLDGAVLVTAAELTAAAATLDAVRARREAMTDPDRAAAVGAACGTIRDALVGLAEVVLPDRHAPAEFAGARLMVTAELLHTAADAFAVIREAIEPFATLPRIEVPPARYAEAAAELIEHPELLAYAADRPVTRPPVRALHCAGAHPGPCGFGCIR